jgi:AAA+ superfamily predicted ATPase
LLHRRAPCIIFIDELDALPCAHDRHPMGDCLRIGHSVALETPVALLDRIRADVAAGRGGAPSSR